MIVRAVPVDVVHHLVADQKPSYGFLDDEPVLMDVPAAVDDAPLVAVGSEHANVAVGSDEPTALPAPGTLAPLRVGLLNGAHSVVMFRGAPKGRARMVAQHLVARLAQLLLHGERLAKLLAAGALDWFAALVVVPRLARLTPSGWVQRPALGAVDAGPRLLICHKEFYIELEFEC